MLLEHALEVALIAEAMIEGNLCERGVRDVELLGRGAHAKPVHAVADRLSELTMKSLAEVDGVDSGGESDILHHHPIAVMRVQVVARALKRRQIARCWPGRGGAGDDLQRARVEVERIAVDGRIAVKREQVPRRARSGEIAERTEVAALDVDAVKQLRTKLEHQKSNAGRADEVLMLEGGRVVESCKTIEAE